MKWVVLDFETASAVDLKKAGAWRYAEDPSTEILCCCLCAHNIFVDGTYIWRPEYQAEDHSVFDILINDPECIFIAHNAAFEKAIWRNIMMPEFGFPDIPNKRWHDTMAVCAHYALPMELEKVLGVLKIGQAKDMEGRKVTLGMSKTNKAGNYDRSEEKRERTIRYCMQD